MKAYVQSTLLSLFFICSMPFTLAADEVTDVVNDVAVKLVSQLPIDKKIALKSLSPDETGLPEDFLRKLTSDLEAALLTASDFEINLANRATMEDVWQEAVEFNNADFDELFKSANADVMLMISPRAISTGVEIAITAYSLTGDSVGKTIASSGSVLLPIDLKANLGVDVNDLNQQMSQVLAEIEKVGQTGGVISNPNTYAEFYHNARILQQRGEVDLAMLNYEQAIASDIVFVDPIEDVIDLAIARYGKNYAKYIEKQILPKIKNANARQYIEWKLAPDFDKITPNEIAFETIFPPILFQWLKQHQKLLEENVRTSDNNQKTDYTSLYLLLEGSRLALRYQQTGEVQKYYIDNFRVRSDIDVGLLTNLIEELNRAEYKLFTSVYEVGTGSKFFDYSLALEEECLDESWGILGADPWEAMGFWDLANTDCTTKLADYIDYNPTTLDDIDFSKIFLTKSQDVGGAEVHNIGPCGSFFSVKDSNEKSRHSVQPINISNPIFRATDTQTDSLSFAKPTMHAAYDQLVFADLCSKFYLEYQGRPWGDRADGFELHGLKLDEFISISTHTEKFQDQSVILHGVSDLIITDRVDVAKPIIVTYGGVASTYAASVTEDPISYSADITRDGTYLRQLEFFAVSNHEEITSKAGTAGVSVDTDLSGWLAVPAVLQSSVGGGVDSLVLVEYTDVYGNARSVDFIFEASRGYKGIVTKNRETFGDYDNHAVGMYSEAECSYYDYRWHDNPCTEGAFTTLIGDYSVIRNFYFHESRTESQESHVQPDWCPRAKTLVEQTVCSNAELSQLDIEINDLYKQLRSDPRVKALARKSAQNRTDCGSNAECIQKSLGRLLTSMLEYNDNDEGAFSIIACGVPNASASIANVQNFTNLRRQAGLNGQVIGQVPLGAQVSVINPGQFLRYDRCAATCNGANQSAIKQCIDNNDVWIEVQYNGRRGFLSRKFLE